MTTQYAILCIFMLPTGITLTIITILRMRAGKITLPQWAKTLLISGMILSQVILAAAMLPTKVYQAVADTFISTSTQSATQIDPPPIDGSIPVD